MMPIINDSSMVKRSGNLPGESSIAGGIKDITKDLSWVDMLKGIAIISVIFGNWLTFFSQQKLTTDTHDLFSTLTSTLDFAIGPIVHLFIILSGFGLTLGYFKHLNTSLSWKAWMWRRITKTIFPYYLSIILVILLGLLGSVLYANENLQFSWPSLLALLTFTRNFYPPSWAWNPPLWFMPVIVGLYLIFPVLLSILKKWGPVKLLLLSTFISYTSLIVAFAFGMTGSHASDLFLSWTVQFVMGMLLAYLAVNHTGKLRLLLGILPFVIGAVFIFCSILVRDYIPNGKVFNDPITSIGIFLIFLNGGWALRRVFPAVNNPLISVSKQSYFMYLIHYPLMMFLIGPIFKTSFHPVITIILCGIYIVVIYYLCSLLSKPITNMSSKLSALFVGKTARVRG